MTTDRRQAVRILFVFAWLPSQGEDTEAHLLARALDPEKYRIDLLACFRQPGISETVDRRLDAGGIDVDTAAYDLSYEDTVDYLAGKLGSYDLIVSCQNVADIYPALELMKWRPPLIERGTSVSEALAGPKHFTARYVAVSRDTRNAAALRMRGREAHSVEIPAMVKPTGSGERYSAETNLAAPPDNRWTQPGSGPVVQTAYKPTEVADNPNSAVLVSQWEELFSDVLAERRPAPDPSLFSSFIQGGFECSTHTLRHGWRLDLLDATHHAANAGSDYSQLAGHGIRTVRDGLRWHLIETGPGKYDWSSYLPMLRDARASGTQVVWDLMHYGWPDDVDIWSPSFVDRFAAYAAAAARVTRSEFDDVPFYCPINEISFHAWGGGDVGYLNPFARHRGFELKVQLARASIAAMKAIRAVEPRARFVHCEPLISIVANPLHPNDRLAAEGARLAQFQACDMISGRMWPQLGGAPDLLDIVGVNYYPYNQWFHRGAPMTSDNALYKPFRTLLAETYARYGRPIMVAETGTEGDARADWFDDVSSSIVAARASGIPVEGVCLYPIIDHVGWDDARDCPSGLMENRFAPDGTRPVHQPLAAAIDRFQRNHPLIGPKAHDYLRAAG